jgi:hypothetical protein
MPVFQIELDWSLSELLGYLYTWSSVQKYIQKNNSDPLNKSMIVLRQHGERKMLGTKERWFGLPT